MQRRVVQPGRALHCCTWINTHNSASSVQAATTEAGEAAAKGEAGWRPLTEGIRLDKYTRAQPAEAEARADTETSDNTPYLSLTKPDQGAIKLEPLEVGSGELELQTSLRRLKYHNHREGLLGPTSTSIYKTLLRHYVKHALNHGKQM